MRDIITSARLTLRSYEAEDAARVCELLGNFDVSKMLSRAPHPYTIDSYETFFATLPPKRLAGTDFVFAITTRAQGLIGAIGLHKSERAAAFGEQLYELGYWIGKPFWGLGYATEAGSAILGALEEDLGPQAVVAGHFTENPQSGHVLEKLGFHYVPGDSTIFCVARQAEVPDRNMVRPASNPNPERSPRP
jgi:RimJ/RimL family protein N-acetyltransferase